MNLRDALPNEPGKRNRPCVVVKKPKVFGDYANVIVVPLTHDRAASFSLVMTTIDPTPENGCDGRCYAVSAHVTSSSRSLMSVRPNHELRRSNSLRSARRSPSASQRDRFGWERFLFKKGTFVLFSIGDRRKRRYERRISPTLGCAGSHPRTAKHRPWHPRWWSRSSHPMIASMTSMRSGASTSR